MIEPQTFKPGRNHRNNVIYCINKKKDFPQSYVWLVSGAWLEQFPQQVDFLLLICHLIMDALHGDPDTLLVITYFSVIL